MVTSSLVCRTCRSTLTLGSSGFVCANCVLEAAATPLDDVAADEATDPFPRRFGDYELLAEIGQGGMGLVFKARQQSLDRIVALKILLTGRFSDEHARRRFRVEAETAARIQHPNIVAIHEVGEAEGHPYLTMEFVEGRNLAELCDSRPLAAKNAARHLRDVARAIHAAHSTGVLHRDLKPSNVLVGADDRPRITDFGLARRLDETAGALTLTGQVLGSPSYAAPEQAAGKQELISAATDVYGLGALLYHLLTGHPPFSAPTPAETLRLVLDTEPPAPRLRNAKLPCDLETICLKCLRKEPTQRYASAAEVADECERFLADAPIRARPASQAEVAWRWCRRYPGTAALAGIATTLLLGLAIGGPLVALRLARAQASAAAEAAASKAVSEFLQNDLLAQAAPDNQPDRDVKLRTVLDRAAQNIEGRFADQPLVDASIRVTLADTYRSLGDYPAARLHRERALALYQADPAEEAKALATAVGLATDISYCGDNTEAAGLLEGLVPQLEARYGRDHDETLDAMSNLAGIYRRSFRLADAEALYTRVLASRFEHHGLQDAKTLEVMSNLGVVLKQQTKYAEAEALQSQALEMFRKLYGSDGVKTATVMSNLALVLQYQGKLAEAEALARESLAVRERVYGPEHPDTLISLNNLALICSESGPDKRRDAEKLYAQVIEIRQRVSGAEHADTLPTMFNLGRLYQEDGRLQEAGIMYHRIVDIAQRIVKRGHPYLYAGQQGLGCVMLEQGHFTEAEALLRESFETQQEFAPDDWYCAQTQSWLGAALTKLQRFEEAEPMLLAGYETLLAMQEKIAPQDRGMITQAAGRITQLYIAWGRPEKADAWQQRLAAAETIDR